MSAPLARTSRGEAVRRWQLALVDAGYTVTPDGKFGISTEEATALFQREFHLIGDGIVGPRTRAALAHVEVRGARCALAIAAAGGTTVGRFVPDASDFAAIQPAATLAGFLAQCAHESGGWNFLEELWGPTPAQLRYEGRLALGNTRPGDGRRFRGRGYIQITGRSNYHAASRDLGIDFEAAPSLAADPAHAARLAVWYWQRFGCDAAMRPGTPTAFRRVTKIINGGYTGYADRVRRWERAKAALAIA